MDDKRADASLYRHFTAIWIARSARKKRVHHRHYATFLKYLTIACPLRSQ